MTKQNNVGLFFLLVLTILFSFGHQAVALTTDYEYDDQYRLTKVTRSDGTVINYTYDEAGNRTRMLVTTSASAQYQLTVSKNGTGSGTITSAPAGINCGDTCNALFDEGQAVTLTAAATGGSAFTGWSGGGCSGTGTCVVTMDAAKNIAAAFNLLPVIPTPPTTGTIGSDITITGSNFGATQGSGYVDFNGIHGTIISWSNTQIVVTVPADATSGCLKVVAAYSESDCMNFTVTVAPLYGLSFKEQAAAGSHYWRAISSSYDGTKLAAAGSDGDISISTDSGATWANSNFNGAINDYAWPYSSITSSSDGTKLAAAASGCKGVPEMMVCFSAIANSSDSGVTFTRQDLYNMYSGAGSGAFIASSSDGTKLAAAVSGGYIYTSIDSGATWTERTGAGSRYWSAIASSSDGTKLAADVSGGYIYTSMNSGATWTEQTEAGSRSWSAIASSSDGTKLAAAVSGGYIYTGYYHNVTPVVPTPPTTGAVGSDITITGSNFGATQGPGYVDFNGVHGTIVSWSDTQIVVTVPVGSTSGCMKVFTDYGSSECVNFTVVAASLYGSFPNAGIWQWGGSGWTQLTTDNPESMVAAGSNLYGKFGNGIWQWTGSGWNKLTPDKPAEMVAAGSNLYGNFTGNGIWQWNGSGWSQLTSDNPQTMVAAGSNLYGKFANGIWQWTGSGWNKLTPDKPAEMVAAGSNLYGSFTGSGIWQWNGSGWSLLTPDIPEAMSAAGSNLYGKFGNGIWQWNGSGWSKLTPDKPASMASAGSNLYGSFTGNGIWQWNGSGWSQLTPDNPAIMAVGE